MTRIVPGIFILLTSLPSFAADDLSNELALAESWLAAQRAYDHVPGLSAAIVHDQDLLWSGASGYADLDSKRPASADTIYGICSISKLFTGIAVMQLRDQGKVQLDEPVTDMLPWFNLKQSFEGSPGITLRNLLTHAAGLPREADAPYWVGPDFPFPTREQVRECWADRPPSTRPTAITSIPTSASAWWVKSSRNSPDRTTRPTSMRTCSVRWV